MIHSFTEVLALHICRFNCQKQVGTNLVFAMYTDHKCCTSSFLEKLPTLHTVSSTNQMSSGVRKVGEKVDLLDKSLK